MADGAGLALQAALVSWLRADPALFALVAARVYDEPPDGVTYPYVRIGNIDVAADRIGCYVDDTVTFSIETHSRVIAGRVEATRIAETVRRALDDAPIPVTGFGVDWLDFLTQTVSRSSDGASYLAISAFEAALAPAA